jgi:hypothetical protein
LQNWCTRILLILFDLTLNPKLITQIDLFKQGPRSLTQMIASLITNFIISYINTNLLKLITLRRSQSAFFNYEHPFSLILFSTMILYKLHNQSDTIVFHLAFERWKIASSQILAPTTLMQYYQTKFFWDWAIMLRWLTCIVQRLYEIDRNSLFLAIKYNCLCSPNSIFILISFK